MTGLSAITALFSRWIDAAAGAIVSAFSSFGRRKTVQVIEEDEGSFLIQAAGRNTRIDPQSAICSKPIARLDPSGPCTDTIAEYHAHGRMRQYRWLWRSSTSPVSTAPTTPRERWS